MQQQAQEQELDREQTLCMLLRRRAQPLARLYWHRAQSQALQQEREREQMREQEQEQMILDLLSYLDSDRRAQALQQEREREQMQEQEQEQRNRIAMVASHGGA